MDMQGKSTVFKPSDRILIPPYIQNISRYVTELESVKVRPCGYLNCSVGPWKVPLPHFEWALYNENLQKEERLKKYCVVVSYPLAMHATNEIIDISDTEVTNIKQPVNLSAIHIQKSRGKTLRCGRAYEIAHLRGGFVEDPIESFRYSMKTYWKDQLNATLQNWE